MLYELNCNTAKALNSTRLVKFSLLTVIVYEHQQSENQGKVLTAQIKKKKKKKM